MQTAIIIGAGPAGLTTALELCRRSAIKPIVLESSDRLGGISCTIEHNGNRIDIGGHRFFSKSDRVMDWWTEIMPVSGSDPAAELTLGYHNQSRTIRPPSQVEFRDLDHCSGAYKPSDCVMLVRPRRSRIYFMRSFFDYPISLSGQTLGRLGLRRTVRIGLSYLGARIFQRKPEKTLEDFLINRFGRELYLTFFKSYTEKVWGVPCDSISAAWGAQRIKGLSLRSAVVHFVKDLFARKNQAADIRQKSTETSLIEKFLYPKYGPGQLWERVAELVRHGGGEVRTGWRVIQLNVDTIKGVERVTSVRAMSPEGETVTILGDYCFSTMPVRELLHTMNAPIPKEVQAISDGLIYRDFITIGLLVDRLLITEKDGSAIKDTWIYIQEPDVLLGRLQIFNNWSPHLVADPSKVWIGLEYFCYDSDPLWKKSDADLIRFAVAEVVKIGILRAEEVRDSCVFRIPKTYPAYFGTYDRFDDVVRHMDRYENLFLIGRNGMHKYNNQDHSMLTAMVAVDNILAGRTDKSNLWEINTESDYHENKGSARVSQRQNDPETSATVREEELTV